MNFDVLPNPGDDPESRLAYLLQHGSSADPQLLEILIQWYAPEIYRLARSLLDEGPRSSLDHVALHDLVVQTFRFAITHTDTFWGETSVRLWLFKLTFQQFRRQKLPVVFRRSAQPLPEPVVSSLRSIDELKPVAPVDGNTADLWEQLEDLPQKMRVPLVLFYAFGLDIEQIGQLIKRPARRVRESLLEARQGFMQELPTLAGSQTTAAHPETILNVRRAQDGLLERDPMAESELRQHMGVCIECRSYAEQLQKEAQILRTAVEERYPRASFWSNEHRQALLTVVRASLSASRQVRLPVGVREMSWAGILLVVLALVYSAFQRYVPDVSFVSPGGLPANALLSPTRTPFPTVVSPGAIIQPGQLSTYAGPNVVYNIEPAVSDDGVSIAFTSLANFWVKGDTNSVPDVFVFDRPTGLVERISIASDGSQAQSWSSSPSISRDGRYVAFVSAARNLSGGYPSCASFGRSGMCSDIYVHDRLTGETRRITWSYNGGQPDGVHFTPVLSADGRYVAFWSTAHNLVRDSQSLCSQRGLARACLELYVYDLREGEMHEVVIGRSYNPGFYLEKPALSADGSWLALAILQDDLVASQLGVTQAAEIFALEWQEGLFERVSIADDGTPANDRSYNPAISGDGRYVAFASAADNLSAGDENESVDVFVYDRQLRTQEIASLTDEDIQATGDSGILTVTNQPWAEQLSLSEDGRKVVFISIANNLAQETQGDCWWQFQNGSVCVGVYLRDLQAGTTQIVKALAEQRLYHSPVLSSDGEWVAFSMQVPDCQGGYPYRVCGEIGVVNPASGQSFSLVDAISAPAGSASDHSTFNHVRGLLFGGRPWAFNRSWSSHQGQANSVAFSPKGDTFASAGQDGRVIIWEAGSGHMRKILDGLEAPVQALAFSPHADWLAAGSDDGTVMIWRLSDGSGLYTLQADRYERPGSVHSLAVSPQGDWLAVGTEFGLHLWNKSEKSFFYIPHPELPPAAINDLDFSRDGSWLLVAASDDSFWVIDMEEQKLLARYSGHDDDLLVVAFSPDGEYIASAGKDGRVNLWRFEASSRGLIGATYVNTTWHENWVTSLAFSPDGERLVSGSFDDTMRVREVPEGQLEIFERFDPGEHLLSLAFSPDGNSLIAGSAADSLHLWIGPQINVRTRFFVRLDVPRLDRPPVGIEPFQTDGNLSAAQALMAQFNNSLYSAQNVTNINVKAPLYLPPGVRYLGTWSPSPDGHSVVSIYQVEDEGVSAGILVLKQAMIGSELFTMEISEDARVDRADVGGKYGEFIQGNWVMSDLGRAWYFDPDLPVMRLRWQDTYWFGLDYFGNAEASADSLLTRIDLQDIAQRLGSLPQFIYADPVPELSYTVREGETVDYIAARYGTTIASINNRNNLGSGDLILVGQSLRVPITRILHDLIETDLDCDGAKERLMVHPDPFSFGRTHILGLVLQMQLDTGFYETVWSLTVADVQGSENFSLPSLVSNGGCGSLIKFEIVMQDGAAPQEALYAWDGERMTRQ